MGLLKSISVLVAVLAVAIGIIGKLMPEIFLNIPFGFVPFMLFGGNGGRMPPFFDVTPFQDGNYREWLRDGDVVVATGGKAGTTWMCYCMDAIRRKGSDEMGLSYADIMLTTPWMELTQSPGEKWVDRKEKYNSTILKDGTKLKDYWDNAAFPFRVFKSHFGPIGSGPFDVLPVKEMPNVKFLVSTRDPFEVGKSIHTFFPKHSAEFKKMWGGFPPNFPDAEAAMKELLPGATLYDMYFGYVKGWWPYVKEPNVLALHYTDMVKDVPALVNKLAKFAGVALNAAETARVTEKCSFAHMKTKNHFFDYQLPMNTKGARKIFDGSFINKGQAGGGKKGVSDEALKAFQAAIDSELQDPALKKWALHGGEV